MSLHSHNLTFHIRRKSSFQCDFPGCGKTFKFSNSLKAHKEIHLPRNERATYECPLCAKTIMTKPYLKKHLALHDENQDDNKPFECNLCQKKCRTREHLKLHLRSHLQEKPFKCALCEASFCSTSGLAVHRRNRHVEKERRMLSCSMYKATYLTKKALKVHVSSVHEGTFFNCPVNLCKSQFGSVTRLESHLKTAHGSIVPCPRCGKHVKEYYLQKFHVSSWCGCWQSGEDSMPGGDLWENFSSRKQLRRETCKVAPFRKPTRGEGVLVGVSIL